MMKYRAKCTYCITQVMNIYSNRQKNPMPKDDFDTYIEVETLTEYYYIDTINRVMKDAYMYLHELENFIETEKP